MEEREMGTDSKVTWKIRDVKRKAAKAVLKNFFSCFWMALIVLLITSSESLYKDYQKDQELNDLYIRGTQYQKDQNFIYDVYMIYAEYHYNTIVTLKGDVYHPSEAGKKLADFLTRFLPYKAEHFSFDRNNEYINIFFYRSQDEPNFFGFPTLASWGLSRPLATAGDVLASFLKLIFAIVLAFLILPILQLTEKWFYLATCEGEKPKFSDGFLYFIQIIDGKLRGVGTILLMELKILLWSLLLVIPGIVKAYEYCMVPYILATKDDRERISAKEIMAQSREMTRGHKWKLFLFSLSFLGWMIPILVISLLGIVFPSLVPNLVTIVFCALWYYSYMQASLAQVFVELSQGADASVDDEAQEYGPDAQDAWYDGAAEDMPDARDAWDDGAAEDTPDAQDAWDADATDAENKWNEADE